MKIRSTLSLAVLALAVTSTMAAPAFARSQHHHGKRAAMAPHASPAQKVVAKTAPAQAMTTHASPAQQTAAKTAPAQAAAVPAPAPHN